MTNAQMIVIIIIIAKGVLEVAYANITKKFIATQEPWLSTNVNLLIALYFVFLKLPPASDKRILFAGIFLENLFLRWPLYMDDLYN